MTVPHCWLPSLQIWRSKGEVLMWVIGCNAMLLMSLDISRLVYTSYTAFEERDG